MKKEFILGFIFVLSCFSLVAAASCDDSQTIMRLYSSNNSHVSAWDENVDSYVEEICYNDIFGFDYVGDDVHSCTGTNRILSLYSSNNSHASEVTDDVYDYEVCYGSLGCVYDSSVGDSCSNDGEIIARMSSELNAHVSYASDLNYSIKICCESMGVYWADMNGNEITNADFGDMVQLVAGGVGSGTFEIKENDFFDDDIKSIVGESVGSNLIGFWTIEEEDMEKTSDYDEFYFEVNGMESGYLNIDVNGDDDPMSVSIVSPVCGEVYDESVDVEIIVAADDDDDFISGTITINGEQVVEFSNGGISFIETLDAPGTVQIVVEASNTRGENKRAISNIMVLDIVEGEGYVDGSYIAACIIKPEDFSDIPGSVVEFDASTTRGVRVVGGSVELLVPGEDAFSWYWMFYPEEIARNFVNSIDPLAYKFTAEFPVAGDNSASLRVEV